MKPKSKLACYIERTKLRYQLWICTVPYLRMIAGRADPRLRAALRMAPGPEKEQALMKVCAQMEEHAENLRRRLREKKAQK